MQCQYCHQNPATIHLQMNFNGQRIQIDLCQNCYQKLQNLQTDMMNGGNGMNNFGFGSLEDFMNAMNNMQSQAAGANGQNMNGQSQRQGGGRNGKGILGQYGINLTDLARQGKIDPVIGRDNEIKRVIEILNRRTKNNPVLIGEAGVGKTAVVEGLAQAIVSGQVPEKLANKEIIRLDVVSLVQGTGIRGQFEKRMQQLMEEVRKNKLIKEQQAALRHLVELQASPVKTNAVYVEYCIYSGISLSDGLSKTALIQSKELMDFATTNPRKFNEFVNDKNLLDKAFIETLITRGELVRSDFNQQISTPDGEFIGANINEAISYFKNPNNAGLKTKLENKLKLI